MPENLIKIVPAAVTGILSGVGDSYGFIHAAKIWQKNQLQPEEMLKSGLGFAFGIGLYWISVKYLKELGINSPTIQTLSWFAATVVGVSLFSGEFARWPLPEKAVGLGVIAGLGWLMTRVSS